MFASDLTNTPMKFEKELSRIKEGLPHGAIKEIAEQTEFSDTYVSRFFDGDYKVTQVNKKILIAAQNIIKREKESVADIQKQITKTLNQ